MRGIEWLKWLLAMAVCLLMFSPGYSQSQNAKTDLEGWVNVPGGTVWLRPNVDSYEHSTGLVRDMRTGQKYHPITPQSIAQAPIPPVVVQPIVQPQVVPQIVQPLPQIIVQPQAVAPQVSPSRPVQPPTYLPNPYYAPFQPSARPKLNSSRYDYGPYGAYGCMDCGLEQAPYSSRLNQQFGTLKRF